MAFWRSEASELADAASLLDVRTLQVASVAPSRESLLLIVTFPRSLLESIARHFSAAFTTIPNSGDQSGSIISREFLEEFGVELFSLNDTAKLSY